MKMNKKEVKLIALIALLLLFGTVTNDYVYAANRTDTTFSFSLNPKGGKKDYDHSAWRSKDNKSAIYMKVNSVKYSNNTAKAWAQGKVSSGSSKYYDCSGGHFIAVNKKGVHYLPNTVKQSKYGYARIGVQANSGAKNTLQGVWSPDSGKTITP